MALSLGSALATKVYLGATEVSLAYLGATQVYTSSAFSAEAQDYFDRLDTAGDTTYTPYKQALANYIDSLVTLGGAYWDDLESAASFVGVGIQGVTVPLKSTMPTLTNNNFVAGDLDPLTGLLSDGSTKYLATGLTGTDLSQNDHSLSVYASSGAITGFLGGTYSTNFTRPIAVALVGTGTSFYSTAPLNSSSKITSTPSLVGLSRSASTEFTARTNQGDETFTRTSGTPNTGGLSLYAVGAGVAPTVARLATYHAGPALNLATLEGLQETLLNEVAAAGLILDVYNDAAAAYSLRNLKNSWTTSDVVEVRRSSDNATSGFTATEISDGTMLAWVGTGGTDNGFVTTWYDQSGNTNNAVQATTTKQPKIVSAGAVVVENSKPALSFDGGDYFQDTFAIGTTSTGFIVGKTQVGDAFLDDIAVVNGNNIRTLSATEVRYATNSGAGGSTLVHTVPSGTWNNQNLISYISDGANSQVGVNDSATTGSLASPTNVTGVTIGAAQNGNAGVAGTMQEVIVYPSNQLSNTFNIEANINTEYSIYTQEFSEEAQNYFNRLNGAGDTTYTAYKQPLANYIDSLVALGGAYWDDMESAALFVGVGIQGVTVPLKSTMPTLTNNNFVAGDLNTLTGLKGDASTKYLDTGALDNSTSQNDVSLSVWVTDNVPLDNAYWIGSQRLAQRSAINNTAVKFSARTTSSSQVNPSPDLVDGFIGQTRTVGTDFDWFINTNSGNFVKASTTPPGTGISVFSYGAGSNKNASRIATYHYGPALNLATLEGLQDTLISEIAAV